VVRPAERDHPLRLVMQPDTFRWIKVVIREVGRATLRRGTTEVHFPAQ
jgi:hypothetical protein